MKNETAVKDLRNHVTGARQVDGSVEVVWGKNQNPMLGDNFIRVYRDRVESYPFKTVYRGYDEGLRTITALRVRTAIKTSI